MLGLGILVVPMIVLTVGDARAAAAWLLPVLCTADIFAVVYWRRHAAIHRLWGLAPWALAGMAAGAAALALEERILRAVVGAIVLIMLAAYLIRRYSKTLRPSRPTRRYTAFRPASPPLWPTLPVRS